MTETQIRAEMRRLNSLPYEERPPTGLLREAAILILQYEEELQFGPLSPYADDKERENVSR